MKQGRRSLSPTGVADLTAEDRCTLFVVGLCVPVCVAYVYGAMSRSLLSLTFRDGPLFVCSVCARSLAATVRVVASRHHQLRSLRLSPHRVPRVDLDVVVAVGRSHFDGTTRGALEKVVPGVRKLAAPVCPCACGCLHVPRVFAFDAGHALCERELRPHHHH